MRLTHPDLPLHAILSDKAESEPDRVAIVFEERRITFAELDAGSNRLAHALRARGLKSGDRLGLFMPNCPEFVISFYAASKLGAIACPLNSSYREREVIYQLNDSGATILITHATLWPIVRVTFPQLKFLHAVIVVGEVGEVGPVAAEHTHETSNFASYADVVSNQPTHDLEKIDPGQLVVLPYSSGTTGLPKGVMLTHRNLVCNQEQFTLATRMGPDDSYIVYMPLSHIMGVALMGVAIRSGAKLILLDRFDCETVVRLIQEHCVTWLFAVPPVLLTLANEPGLKPSQFRTVKFVFCAAAPLAPEVARRVEARLGLQVVQGYGLTEASPATHNSPLEAGRIKLESGGVVVAETEHKIMDMATGERTLSAGDVGEIVVRGPQVMQGYWKAPQETARVLRDGWLYTGDIGWLDQEGYIYIVDRKKEMIKYKSFSVAPAELEAVVLEHPDIEDCAVTGLKDAEAGEVPMAFVVPRADRTIDLDVLRQFVNARVAGYKQIRRFEIIDKIPRTPSGKVLRRVLKELSGNER